jgi:hypothetical protein
VNRNIDISDEVLKDPRCKVLEQVRNGVAVRAAILKKLILNNNRYMEKDQKQSGLIKQVVGAVVDVYFEDHLPAIHNALEVIVANKKLILEVQQHLGFNVVRTIAMGGYGVEFVIW